MITQRLLVLALGAIGLALGWGASVRAQTTPPAGQITHVATGQFPQVQVYAQITGVGERLPASAFSLTEGTRPVPNLNAQPVDAPLQIVFALDANAAFRSRDINGISRLDDIKTGLLNFVQNTAQMQEGVDDVSILTADGVVAAHLNTRPALAAVTQAFTATFGGSANPEALFTEALALATESAPQPYTQRAVVWFSNGLRTPPDDWAVRARTAGVVVHTVYVGPAGSEATTGAQNVQRLAQQSGGRAVILRGAASLAPLFEAMHATRPHYALTYRSVISQTGQYPLTVQVNLPNADPLTLTGTLRVRVEPPLVEVVGVPGFIAPNVAVSSYPMQALVSFPDGRRRAVTQVALWVDGALAYTTASPEDVLVWSVAPTSQTLTSTVWVQVTDELGLVGESRRWEVVRPGAQAFTGTQAAPWEHALARLQTLTWAQWAAMAGGLVLLVTALGVWRWWQGRARRPAVTATGRARQVRRLPKVLLQGSDDTIPGAPVTSDPRLQAAAGEAATRPNAPLPVKREPARVRPALPQMPHLTLPQLKTAPRRALTPPPTTPGPAYFESIEDGIVRPDIELNREVITLGRDPALAEVVFDDRTVSRLHARVVQTSPGVFQIYDVTSTTGTWVNAQAINGAGHTLQPGDVVTLGRVQLRFCVRPPADESADSLR